MASDSDNDNDNNQTCADEEFGEVDERLIKPKPERNLEDEVERLNDRVRELQQENEELRNGDSVLMAVSLAIIGFSPELLKFNDKKRNKFVFFFFYFVFLADFADAVFDLILAVRTMIVGTGGAGFGFGVLLAITTILGRVVSALYGWRVSNDPEKYEDDTTNFALAEMTIFFLEDGASILVLANSTGGMAIVDKISMWLTIVCALCYIGYLVLVGLIGNCLKGVSGIFSFLLMGLLPAGSAIFQVYILVTEVLLSKDDDHPLSGGLEIAAFVVYGITAVLFGGLTILSFAVRLYYP